MTPEIVDLESTTAEEKCNQQKQVFSTQLIGASVKQGEPCHTPTNKYTHAKCNSRV